MTNDKANTIIDIIQTLHELKESGELLDLKIHWDEENNVLDINTVPKHKVQYVQLDIIITPTGVEFK